jgi:hypothetical protein
MVALGVIDGAKKIAMNKGGTVTPLGPASKSTWCRQNIPVA